MFKKILLPVDLSDRHQQAMCVAADLARRSGGEVVLLHVIEEIAGLPDEDAFYTRLERIARKRLDSLNATLAAQKVSSGVEIIFGNRGREIVHHAIASSADLLILTAPRIDPDNASLGMGSLSYKVALFAPCPVMLVR